MSDIVILLLTVQLFFRYSAVLNAVLRRSSALVASSALVRALEAVPDKAAVGQMTS